MLFFSKSNRHCWLGSLHWFVEADSETFGDGDTSKSPDHPDFWRLIPATRRAPTSVNWVTVKQPKPFYFYPTLLSPFYWLSMYETWVVSRVRTFLNHSQFLEVFVLPLRHRFTLIIVIIIIEYYCLFLSLNWN